MKLISIHWFPTDLLFFLFKYQPIVSLFSHRKLFGRLITIVIKQVWLTLIVVFSITVGSLIFFFSRNFFIVASFHASFYRESQSDSISLYLISTGGSCSQAPFCLCTQGPISSNETDSDLLISIPRSKHNISVTWGWRRNQLLERCITCYWGILKFDMIVIIYV